MTYTDEIRVDDNAVYSVKKGYDEKGTLRTEECTPILTKEIFIECFKKWILDTEVYR